MGTADDEFQLIGSTNNLRYLDGSSVGGAPGLFAGAVAVLSDTPANCTASLRCYIKVGRRTSSLQCESSRPIALEGRLVWRLNP